MLRSLGIITRFDKLLATLGSLSIFASDEGDGFVNSGTTAPTPLKFQLAVPTSAIR